MSERSERGPSGPAPQVPGSGKHERARGEPRARGMTRTRGLRVIAGSARGRRLEVPAGDDVRPTKDMVREAVFSALAARGFIVDATVLDLFAGSGALGIEALSRGAARAVFVERDRTAVAVIERNLATLGFDDAARVARGDAAGFVAGPAPREAPFDLVFADPPYDTTDDAVAVLVGAVASAGWRAPSAVVVVERPATATVTAPPELPATWARTFGDTLVTFLGPV
jgi:16S rRNA (guanine966-N2)-methyltransferase